MPIILGYFRCELTSPCRPQCFLHPSKEAFDGSRPPQVDRHTEQFTAAVDAPCPLTVPSHLDRHVSQDVGRRSTAVSVQPARLDSTACYFEKFHGRYFIGGTGFTCFRSSELEWLTLKKPRVVVLGGRQG